MPESESKPCGQCEKPGLVTVNGVWLRVDHHYKFEVSRTLAFRLAAIGMNQAAAEMDHVTGLYNFTPRIQIPDIPKGPPILNNIHIKDSVVGSVNTGTVHSIDVSVTYLEKSGNTTVGNALKQFTETVANDRSLQNTDKNNLLDQIEYLSRAAADAAKDRKPGMIRAAFDAITAATGAVPTIAAGWETVRSLLAGYFGIG